MNRTSFLIDGFNLYHSIIDIEKHYHVCTKWMDIYSLCDSFLHWVGNQASLQHIFYFSAYAYHSSRAGAVGRHRAYIKCLKDKGIIPVIGRFKEKQVKCPQYDATRGRCVGCFGQMCLHEEKETDVAIAVKPMELFAKNLCDTVVLVTGDTDLAPAIRTVKSVYPNNSIRFIFPYLRKNKELAKLAPSETIEPSRYFHFQLPNPFPLSNGTSIFKPPTW